MNRVTQLNTNKPVRSISFTYNRLIGNKGTTTILNNLPNTIHVIGLVNCGIGDYGGEILLKKLYTPKNTLY